MNAVLKPFCHREPDMVLKDILSKDELNNAPSKSGVYIITSTEHQFQYPNGKSRIIYIGKSNNLKRRLKDLSRVVNIINNLKVNERHGGWHYSRYHYLAKFGGKIYLFTTRGTQDEKNLENKI